jgi:hypothetical protein
MKRTRIWRQASKGEGRNKMGEREKKLEMFSLGRGKVEEIPPPCHRIPSLFTGAVCRRHAHVFE